MNENVVHEKSMAVLTSIPRTLKQSLKLFVLLEAFLVVTCKKLEHPFLHLKVRPTPFLIVLRPIIVNLNYFGSLIAEFLLSVWRTSKNSFRQKSKLNSGKLEMYARTRRIINFHLGFELDIDSHFIRG